MIINKNKFSIVLLVTIISLIILLFSKSISYIGGIKNVPETAVVMLDKNGFNPSEITINQGSTVTFTTTTKEEFWPASDEHPVHTAYPEFDPKGPLGSDETWSFKFEKTGRWEYHDHLNPFYKGKIIVE